MTAKIKRLLSDWVEGLPAAVTVTDERGTIVEMNPRSVETFKREGGADLIGTSVFDCHEGEALAKTRGLYETKTPNHYTIEKEGRRKIIHQIPWFENGRFAGFVEISIPIPDALPHFKRV